MHGRRQIYCTRLAQAIWHRSVPLRRHEPPIRTGNAVIKFSPLFATVLLAQIALGLLAPLTPIMLIAQRVPTWQIGIIGSSYYAGMLGGGLLIPAILSRIGHIRALAIFCVLGADATLTLHEIDAVPLWIAVRLVTGICSIGVFTVVESWLNAATTRSVRGRTFGAYLMSSWAGSVCGAYLLSVVKSVSGLISIGTAGFITALLPITILTRVGPALPPRNRIRMLDLIRLSPAGVTTCFAAGFGGGTFFTMFPVFMERIGIRQDGISVVIALCLLAGMAVQFPIGMLADRIGRIWIIRTLFLVAILACILLMASRRLPFLAAFGALYGGATGTFYGLGAGQTADRANQEQLVGVSSGVLFAWALGACGGPMIAAGAMTLLGYHGLFIDLLALFAMSFLLVMLNANRAAMRPTALHAEP